MPRAEALYGHRLQVESEIVYRFNVFDGKNIVRRFELAGHFAQALCHGSLPCGGKGYALIRCKLCAYIRADERIDECFRYRFENLDLAALAAEAQMRDNARCAEHTHCAACKALRRGQYPRQRKLQHEIDAAAHRRLGTRKF